MTAGEGGSKAEVVNSGRVVWTSLTTRYTEAPGSLAENRLDCQVSEHRPFVW